MYEAARQFIQRADPLVLDLDGDGIETIGIGGANTVLFDHNGNGIKTGTGWLKGDDGFLVLDRNGNGVIDNGGELFGNNTKKSNGQYATDGFDALSDLDSNGDGVFDASDAQFANVRVWRDLNQDGISQANELFTLAQLGIASINLTSTAANTTLAGGNVLTAKGTYTKTNGQTGEIGELEIGSESAGQSSGNAGNLDFASNPFYRQFTNPIPLSEAAAALPDLHGSGMVRDLREAATLDAALVADIQSLDGLSRSQMMSQLDALLAHWAGTANFETSNQRVAKLIDIPYLPDFEMRIVYRVPGMTNSELTLMQLQEMGQGGYANTQQIKNSTGFNAAHYAQMKAESERVSKMLDVLETFNGQTFLNFPNNGGVRMGNGQIVNLSNPGQASGPSSSSGWSIASPVLTAQHINLLQQSYDALKQSVYDALVLETRLKGYLDAVGLIIDEDGIRFDFSGIDAALDTLVQTDPVRAVVDCLDLMRSGNVLVAVGWSGANALGNLLATISENGGADALKAEIALAFASDPGGLPLKIGTSGNDTLTAGAGGDILFGGNGSDTLNGGKGADILIGGKGNDTLKGGAGDDIYVFSKGDGQDVINDYSGSNTIRFLDVKSDEIELARSGNDLKILYGDSDSVTIQNAATTASYRMASYQFADGKSLTTAGLLALCPVHVAAGTTSVSFSADFAGATIVGTDANANTITGGSSGNTLKGGNGTNDKLTGGTGADILIGGKGNDILKGGSGDDTYVFSKGDGQDVINDYQGSNTIRFLDVKSDEIKLVRSGNDLKILYGESDSVTIQNAATTASYRMASYEFADGKSLTTAELFALHPVHVADGMTNVSFSGTASAGLTIVGSDANNNTITGDSGGSTLKGGNGTNDKLYGGTGADILVGGKGNDTLQGGNGNDTYVFSKGDGQDIIKDHQGSNTIRFLDVNSGEIKLVRSGDDLKILYGESDSVTMQYAFLLSSSAAYRMANYEFADGKSLTTAELFALHPVHVADGMTNASFSGTASAGLTIVGSDANNNTITGDSGGSTLKGGNGTNDKLYGGSGADIIISGKGNDTLKGGAGDDIYVFSKGDGQDTITDNQGSNTIRFLDVKSNEIKLVRSGNDLKILYGESDSVTVYNHFTSSAYQMAKYEFADGKNLTPAELFALHPVHVTDGTTSISFSGTGSAGATIVGSDTNDNTITGGSSGNTLKGGNGTNDKLTGGTGADILIGGKGNDLLQGGGGDDIYVFSKGDGQDIIKDNQGANAIRFLDVKSDEITLVRSGTDLKLFYGESDSVTIQSHFSNASYQMASYEFADVTLIGVDLFEMHGM